MRIESLVEPSNVLNHRQKEVMGFIEKLQAVADIVWQIPNMVQINQTQADVNGNPCFDLLFKRSLFIQTVWCNYTTENVVCNMYFLSS